MEETSKQINEALKESYLYKRYTFLKEKIDNDEELIGLKKEMDELKKEICNSKDDSLIDNYYELEKEYKNNLLVKEYLSIKEEMNNLLKDIAGILSLN